MSYSLTNSLTHVLAFVYTKMTSHSTCINVIELAADLGVFSLHYNL